MNARPLPVAVVDAAGASACDSAAIAAGIPSRALMQRAGAAAVGEIVRRFADRLDAGVVVATGPGNNGGDGWVVAHALHAARVRVRVVECARALTGDARAERAEALAAGVDATASIGDLLSGGESIVVDALLGTRLSADGSLRGDIAAAVESLNRLAERGATLVALDVPTGLVASTGKSSGGLRCALTITFGTMKRGHLVARGACGTIVVVDIGLGAHARDAGERMRLATAAWFTESLPPIPAAAHKGTRKKIVIVGGAKGMAGAVVLAARAALRSGAGLVRCVVAPESLAAIQEGEPAALAAAWPADDTELAALAEWADAMLIGPGLGGGAAREMVTRLLGAWSGAVVLDADALNAFAGDLSALRGSIGERPALLTPHPAEFGRLTGLDVDTVLAERFDAPARLARETGAAVLLKGVPTTVASPDGPTHVVAEGTPVLATGGAGDLLGGIAVTLLAQCKDAARAGALAAFAHGRAAAAVSARQVRGYTLDDVMHALPAVWGLGADLPRPPVLAELPAVGEPQR
ncbi:MAG TPA: NAD(P)H-hydrate dehydratase [Gemmatimonadaceae bacterium]|nr:NAD(P)H-hydrate dehydratase [Gemmatimonadaceae bacterium]